MFRFYTIFLLLLSCNTYAQKKGKNYSIILIGKVMEFGSLKSVPFCEINLKVKLSYQTRSSNDGSFIIKIPTNEFKKRNQLTFCSLGYKPFHLKNIPAFDSIIDLGNIIIPNYTHFEDNIKVIKRGQNRISKRKTRKAKNEIRKTNLHKDEIRLDLYEYYFNGKKYKLHFKDNSINLK